MVEGKSTKRCAVVTGSNKGIGFEICRQLASQGVLVVVTARDTKRGVEAVEKLKETGLSDVVFHQLDVTDPASIASLAGFIKTRFGKLDILVNNAGYIGLAYDVEAFQSLKTGLLEVTDNRADTLKDIMVQTIEGAQECFKINYYGIKGVTEALLPFLQLSSSATIVNLSSYYGQISYISNKKVKAELSNDANLTEAALDKLLQGYLKDFEDDKLEANGWPITVSAYKVSKIMVNAYTRILAKKFLNMRINCVHPGYVKTDMVCFTGLLTTEEAAKGPVMLALLPDNGPSGQFFNKMDVSPFDVMVSV